MTDFAQMHIFFLVTTVTVAILGVLLALICFRVYQILSDVEHISRNMSEESALIRGDIADARHHIRTQGFHMKCLTTLFRSTLGRFMRNKKRRE